MYKFIGYLEKDDVRYYFAVNENAALIEKYQIVDRHWVSQNKDLFAVTDARRYYKILLKKGFVLDDFEQHEIEFEKSLARQYGI